MSSSDTRSVETDLARSVRVTGTRLIVELVDGREISVPLEWFPRLAHGTAEERANWRLIGIGEGITWPDLDEDLSVEGLLAGRKSCEGEYSFARWLKWHAKPAPKEEFWQFRE